MGSRFRLRRGVMALARVQDGAIALIAGRQSWRSLAPLCASCVSRVEYSIKLSSQKNKATV